MEMQEWRTGGLMVSYARATRGLSRPSLDARSKETTQATHYENGVRKKMRTRRSARPMRAVEG